ncbi:MAG TPA: M14 family zinc carboxypeptidase [Vicinamibacteria bacterium]|nr:M14 family zinc carboxypeptidase [Vicinamibacteria bacterium]
MLVALALGAGALLPAPDPGSALWDSWPSRRFVNTPAPCLRHAELVERLRALAALHRGRLSLEEVGRSVQGRPIHLLRLGRGPRLVLLWSQMHGDEPSATPALLDVADTLLASEASGDRAVLEELTLLMVPMLNPDGAERRARRNAQGIDVNRDALALSTPEGRALKAVRDRFQPELGFNLHDQGRRTTVGDTGVLATISLLAVSGDAQGRATPGRERARRVCSAIARALEPFVPGGIARYDEDWNPRAFGDNLTAWGTPVVLVESGGLPPGRPLTDLTRLNYVALLTVLRGLARDDVSGATAEAYEGLRRNEENLWTDVLLAGGRVWQPGAGDPYRADVAFDVLDDDPLVARCAEPGWPGASRIREVGDGRLLGTARRLDVSGRLVAPAFAASVRGTEPRSWLTASSLAAIGRLGVARLVWQVAPGSRPEALAHAGRLAAAGRPAIEVVDASAPASLLEIDGPPSSPSSPSLAAALDALTRGGWRARAGSRPLDGFLADLAGADPALLPLIAPDTRASLVVLRPREEGVRDAGRVDLEAVFIDGREPGAAR